MQDLRKLLEDSKAQTAIRTGDILGLIVEFYVQQSHFKEALQVLEEMRSLVSGHNIHRFVTPHTLSVGSYQSKTPFFRTKIRTLMCFVSCINRL